MIKESHKQLSRSCWVPENCHLIRFVSHLPKSGALNRSIVLSALFSRCISCCSPVRVWSLNRTGPQLHSRRRHNVGIVETRKPSAQFVCVCCRAGVVWGGWGLRQGLSHIPNVARDWGGSSVRYVKGISVGGFGHRCVRSDHVHWCHPHFLHWVRA